jgi:rSAM/selenodomain-associated transferase 1
VTPALAGAPTLMVIAKSPVPGRVKTRLCPPCSPTEAATLAEAALGDTLATLAQVSAPARVLALDGEVGPWFAGGYNVVRQQGDGLAARLTHAFSAIRGPALLVGMDTPQCTVALIEEAAHGLTQPGVDAVLGPAYDGGWWCIGFREPVPGAFDRVEMSSANTFRQQHERLIALGLRVHLLPALRDVDTIDDAKAVARIAPDTRFARTLRDLGFMTRVDVA